MFSVGDKFSFFSRKTRTVDSSSADCNQAGRDIRVADHDDSPNDNLLLGGRHTCGDHAPLETVRLVKVLSNKDNKLQLVVEKPDEDYVLCQLNEEIHVLDGVSYDVDERSTCVSSRLLTSYHSRRELFDNKYEACQNMLPCYKDYFARLGWYPSRETESCNAKELILRCYYCDSGMHIKNVEDISELSDRLLCAWFHLGGANKESRCEFISTLLEYPPYCDIYCRHMSDNSMNIGRILSGGDCGSDSGWESGNDLHTSGSRSSLDSGFELGTDFSSSASRSSLSCSLDSLTSGDEVRMSDSAYSMASPDSNVANFVVDESDFQSHYSDEESTDTELRETTTKSATKSESKDICIYCCSNSVNTIAIPCCHAFACDACGLGEGKKEEGKAITHCPICRDPVTIKQPIASGFSTDS